MIIDDDYCQYDTFRIINRADADAIAAFEQDRTGITGKDEQKKELSAWKAKADEMKALTEETEESVYQLTYAERMVRCWTREVDGL